MSKQQTRPQIPAPSSFNRRDWLRKSAGAVVGGAALGVALPGCAPDSSEPSSAAPEERADGIRVWTDDTVVETTAGRVRGFTRNGVHIFRGIPYGDTTAGANRFLPAKPPQPWTGVRSSTSWGPCCPQRPRAVSRNPARPRSVTWTTTGPRNR